MKSNFNYFLILVFFVFSTGSGIYLTQKEGDDPSSILTQAVLASIYLIAFYILIYTIRSKRIQWNWLIILLIYALLSIGWATDPTLSLRKGIGLVGVYILAYFTVTHLDLNRVIKLVFWFFFVCLSLSIVVSILLPELGTSDFFDGAWNGIYTHKNRLGRYSSLFLILSLYIYFNNFMGRKSIIKLIGVLSIGFITLVKAESSTALMTALLSITFGLVIYLLPKKGVQRLTLQFLLLIVGIPLAFILFSNLELLLGLAGKDITLTGRIPLWGLLIYLSTSNPLFGFGYNGFWLGELKAPSDIVLTLLGWYPSQSHNGYIEIYLNLGIVGLIIFIISVVSIILSARRSGERTTLSSRFAIILFILLYNLTESTFLASNGFMWYMFLIIAFSYESQRTQVS